MSAEITSFDQYKNTYDRDGFVIVRQFLTGIDLEELTRELDRYITAVVPTLPQTHAFFDDRSKPETLKQLQYMTVDPFFARYATNPRWLSLARSLVGEEVTCEGPEWFNKPPNTNHPTPPHQDNYYFCLRPPNVITIWLALDHVDEENGCLRYLPGSHLKGIRPHNPTKVLGFSQGIVDYGGQDLAQEVKIILEPGDVVAHHGETVHRAEANRSASRNRRAFAMVCKGVSCRRDEEAYQCYLNALQNQHQSIGLAAV